MNMFFLFLTTSLWELWGLIVGLSESQVVAFPEIVLASSGGGGQAIAETGKLSGIGTFKKS